MRWRRARVPRAGEAVVAKNTLDSALDDYDLDEEEVARFMVAEPAAVASETPSVNARLDDPSPASAPRNDLPTGGERERRVQFHTRRAALVQTTHHEPWHCQLEELVEVLLGERER